mgnify:CR=1 FL=1
MEKVIAVLLAILKIAGQFMEYVMSPSRRRKSVLDQIEKDKQEILHKVYDLTGQDKADRDKARKDLLKEIRE